MILKDCTDIYQTKKSNPGHRSERTVILTELTQQNYIRWVCIISTWQHATVLRALVHAYNQHCKITGNLFLVQCTHQVTRDMQRGLFTLMAPPTNAEVSCNFGDLLAKMEELPRPATAGIAIEVAVIAMSTTAHITGSQRDCSSSTHLEPTRISDQFEITALGK